MSHDFLHNLRCQGLNALNRFKLWRKAQANVTLAKEKISLCEFSFFSSSSLFLMTHSIYIFRQIDGFPWFYVQFFEYSGWFETQKWHYGWGTFCPESILANGFWCGKGKNLSHDSQHKFHAIPNGFVLHLPLYNRAMLFMSPTGLLSLPFLIMILESGGQESL